MSGSSRFVFNCDRLTAILAASVEESVTDLERHRENQKVQMQSESRDLDLLVDFQSGGACRCFFQSTGLSPRDPVLVEVWRFEPSTGRVEPAVVGRGTLRTS